MLKLYKYLKKAGMISVIVQVQSDLQIVVPDADWKRYWSADRDTHLRRKEREQALRLSQPFAMRIEPSQQNLGSRIRAYIYGFP